MSFDPYLHFQGNCEAAMQFYAQVFGADAPYLMRYRDAPPSEPGADCPGPGPATGEDGELIMHAAIVVDGRVLMASDYPPGMPGAPQQAVSISHQCPTRAAAQGVFDALSEAAEIMMPFDDAFWADGFGMLRDRFGTQWMVMGPSLME